MSLALAGCHADPPSESSSDAGDESGESGETGEPVAPGDACETTELDLEAPQPLAASLRHATPSPLAEVCGADGPAVFVRLRVDARADLTLAVRGRAFDPSLAITRPGCVSALDDPGRLLACGHTLPVSLSDIGPGTELLLMIGIAADDPALALEPDADPHGDPLDFELDMQLRAVLDEGQRCGPAYGRCEDGTVCTSADEDGVAVDRCRRPPADSCVAPGELLLPAPGELLSFTIYPDEPHSDAHSHTCTGWRRPERVDRLQLPGPLALGTTLRIRASDPRVGLALRESDCDPAQQLACAAAGAPSETLLSWSGDRLIELAAAGDGPLLFVELPRQDLGEVVGAIAIELELLQP